MHHLLSTFTFVFALTPILIFLVFWGYQHLKNLAPKQEIASSAIIQPVHLSSKDFIIQVKKIPEKISEKANEQQEKESLFTASPKKI